MKIKMKICVIFFIAVVCSSGICFCADLNQSLADAAGQGDIEVVNLLLANGADVNAKRTDDCSTPLSMASLGGHVEVVKLLLANGADVDGKKLDNGEPSLFMATLGDHVDNFTPLSMAALGGHVEVVKLLLDYGADVNAKSTFDDAPPFLLVNSKAIVLDGAYTPLNLAKIYNQTEIVKLLENAGGKC